MSGQPVADKLLSMSAGDHMQEAERYADTAAAGRPIDAQLSQAHSLCAITQLVHRAALAMESQVAELRNQVPLTLDERRRVRIETRRQAWETVLSRLRKSSIDEEQIHYMRDLFQMLADAVGDKQEFPL